MNSKIFFAVIAFCLLLAVCAPFIVKAAGLVTCSGVPGVDGGKCTWDKVKSMLEGILKFIVQTIATPLATLALIIGAIMFMASAGNPGLAGTGKKIMIAALVGLALAWCAVLIVNFVLNAIGATGYHVSL